MTNLVGDAWLVVGDVFTAVAASAALVTVWVTVNYGRKTAKQLKSLHDAARETVTLTAEVAAELGVAAVSEKETAELMRGTIDAIERSRKDVERDRLRDQYEVIGRLVEEIFWATDPTQNLGYTETDWMSRRNALSVIMVGHAEALPLCADVTLSNSRTDAQGKSSRARNEAPSAIERLLAAQGEQP